MRKFFDHLTEKLRPINDKYGLVLSLIAVTVAVFALVFSLKEGK